MNKIKYQYKSGYFYIGYKPNAKKYGIIKIGETFNLKKRITNIRQFEPFEPLAHLKIITSNKCALWLIEAVVRFKLSQYEGLKHRGLDHFSYNIITGMGKSQAEQIATYAINVAKQTCEMFGIAYATD